MLQRSASNLRRCRAFCPCSIFSAESAGWQEQNKQHGKAPVARQTGWCRLRRLRRLSRAPGTAHLWWIRRKYTAKSGVALLPSGQAVATFAAVTSLYAVLRLECVPPASQYSTSSCDALYSSLQLGCKPRLQPQGNPQISEVN